MNYHSLYKYVARPEVAGFILDGAVKFTPPAELNDPSELVPTVDVEAIVASRERLRNHGYAESDLMQLRRQGALMRRLAPEYQAIPVPETIEAATAQIRARFYDDTPLLERMLRGTAEKISSKVGVFCLSERMDSLPMWAHYAANATGLVVEFSGLGEVFAGDETGILRSPTCVRYEDDSSGVTFDPKSHESIFFVKFQDWSYEREVRIVLPLDECRVVAANGSPLYIFDVPKRLISRLILGWRFSESQVCELVNSVRSRNEAVQVVTTSIQQGKVVIADRLHP